MSRIPMQFRADVRTIATILKYYLSNNTPIQDKSNLIRMALEDFARHLVNDKGAKSFNSVEDALLYFERVGGLKLGRATPKKLFMDMANEVVDKDKPASADEQEIINAVVKDIEGEEDDG